MRRCKRCGADGQRAALVKGRAVCRDCHNAAQRAQRLRRLMAATPDAPQTLFVELNCIDCNATLYTPRFTKMARGGYGPITGPPVLRCSPCRSAAAIERAKIQRQVYPERTVQYSRSRYLRRAEQMKASTERWRKNNPDKVRDIRENRRARELGAFMEDVDRLDLWLVHQGLCGICNEPVEFDTAEVDHIIPLSRGGLHSYDNCQPAHVTCNRRKANKLPQEFNNVRQVAS